MRLLPNEPPFLPRRAFPGSVCSLTAETVESIVVRPWLLAVDFLQGSRVEDAVLEEPDQESSLRKLISTSATKDSRSLDCGDAVELVPG
jgi:hypothetical protein